MTTPILGLDELEDSQSQPHVPINAATRALEQYAQLLAVDKDLSSPPAGVEGEAYIVGSGASGAWAGWENSIAYYSGGWLRIEPRVGMTAYVEDEDAYYKYLDGSPGGWELWALESASAAAPYTQLLVIDQDLSAPPGSPADGDAYIVASGGSGAWTGWDGSVAYYSGGWLRFEPGVGTVAYVLDEDTYYKYSGDSPSDWQVLTFSSPPVAQPYDIGAQLSGAPTASLVMLRYKFPRTVLFPASLTDSQGTAGTAATAQTDFDVRKNGASVGTIRFAAAGTSATFIQASPQTYSAGDILTVVAPASPDATLANVSFVLAGTR
jgi:hypothetical protein